MSTLDYYEQNSQSYIEATFKVDMSTAYQLFERYLPPHAVILDLGCGSGRDALYFKQKYEVLAVDPVMEFVQHAQALGLNIDKEDHVAEVLIDDGAMPLALGRFKSNLTLAKKITGYDIDFVEKSKAE
ncbi:MAG: class I SAM-dependent methyltransferase, partial [bacterium]